MDVDRSYVSKLWRRSYNMIHYGTFNNNIIHVYMYYTERSIIFSRAKLAAVTMSFHYYTYVGRCIIGIHNTHIIIYIIWSVIPLSLYIYIYIGIMLMYDKPRRIENVTTTLAEVFFLIHI